MALIRDKRGSMCEIAMEHRGFGFGGWPVVSHTTTFF